MERCSEHGPCARQTWEEAELEDRSKKVENRHVDGCLFTNIYRSADDPDEFWIAVVFRVDASYRKNPGDPVQDQWFRELMTLLEPRVRAGVA